MPRYFYKYSNQESFDNAEDSLDELKYFTALKKDEKQVEFKEHKVVLPIKPIEESVAADICLVDNGGNKYIVDGNSYSIDLFPAEQYTPIGVVVVPASHTDDRTARIISLASMDYNNPDDGNTSGHVNMSWGGYNSNVPNIPFLTKAPCIATAPSALTASEQSIIGWEVIYTSQLCSDYYTNYQNPYDTNSYYQSSDLDCLPSPYLTGGAKNEIYHSTTNTNNALADMDGKNNTSSILAVDNGVSTDWQTADTITNTGRTETIHPAAQCCWRYHTTGTTQGEWYLPAAGEMGYLVARWKAINESIQKVVAAGFAALELPVDYGWWSSSEYSSASAVRLDFFSSYADLNFSGYKYGSGYVRAFCAV